MVIGAFAPLVVFVAILGSVGVRLVSLWRRTRETPELCLGAGLLIMSLSMPLSAIGRIPATAMEPLGRACFAAGIFAVVAGTSLMVYFNYHVFRRGSEWGLTFLTLACGMLTAAALYMSVSNFQGESVAAIKQAMRPGTLLIMSTMLACFFWAGVEAFICRGAALRQLAVGLGDPAIANRFLLWGVASVTCALLLLVLIGCVMTGMTILREPGPLAAIALAGTVMSASWYLTFFAPERYLAFIRARAASHTSA
jgi:hypothetical protein